MADEKRDDDQSLLSKLIALLLRLDWLDVLDDVWKVLRKALPGQSYKGLYEVLVYCFRWNWTNASVEGIPQ
jgi:hypothetical protein